MRDSQTPEPNDEIILDGARLRRALRRQGRLWLWLGPLAAGLLLLLLAALVPRTYTATTSVALQQSSPASPLAQLAGIGGGGGGGKRYLGVLKSRALAAAVERHIQLRQVYGAKKFPTEESAVTLLMNSIKADDNAADGLLYISVSLPGPPKLALHPSPGVPQVEDVAAEAANDYAMALKEYFATNDTDQGTALLRGADKEVRLARARYEDALARSLDFTHGLSRVDPRSQPSPGGAAAGPFSSGGDPSALPASSPAVRGVDAETAASGLAGLYATLDGVQEELSETQAVRATGQALIGTQLQDLSKVPTDDPLLADARSRVMQDRAAYTTLSSLYAPGSQNVNLVAAKTRLDFDQADLDRQIAGIKQRLTTPDVRSAEQIKGLYAKQAALLRQIAQTQRHLGVSRQLSGEAGRLQAEVGIQLDVLRTTLSEAAKIRLDNASSLSRMSVIDTALPPKSGEPGLLKLAAVCLALAALAFLVSLVRDYLRSAPNLPGGGSGILSPEDAPHAAVHPEVLGKT
jgi:uncharacterized protein involved in exopolysaccharide biosynthesis